MAPTRWSAVPPLPVVARGGRSEQLSVVLLLLLLAACSKGQGSSPARSKGPDRPAPTLEADDVLPPTTYSVRLQLGAPPVPVFTNSYNWCGKDLFVTDYSGESSYTGLSPYSGATDGCSWTANGGNGKFTSPLVSYNFTKGSPISPALVPPAAITANIYGPYATVNNPVVAPPAGVSWNVYGTLAVRPPQQSWQIQSCALGDVTSTQANPDGYDGFWSYSNKDDAFFGVNGTWVSRGVRDTVCGAQNLGAGSDRISFGSAGQPLQQLFTAQDASGTIHFGVALDNIATLPLDQVVSAQAQAAQRLAQAGDAFSVLGNVLQTAGGAIGMSGSEVALVGTILGTVGSAFSLAHDSLPLTDATVAQQSCLGGMLGNPAPGSTSPQDSYAFGLTGKQLYEGTRNGPLTVTYQGREDWTPPNPPLNGYCRAAPIVKFVIERASDPTLGTWGNGTAFQSRSADSAVVRRPNAIESFRANLDRGTLEHDSWRYYNDQDAYPVQNGDLTRSCPSPTGAACAPLSHQTSATDVYRPTELDPTGALGPRITSAAMPVTALSRDPNRLAVFYADGTGGLFLSAATYANSDAGSWNTWLLATDLPANTEVAAVPTTLNGDQYSVFWVGLDGFLYGTRVTSEGGTVDPVTRLSNAPIAAPGAAVAAVARTPAIADVFVVGTFSGQSTVWDFTGDPRHLTQGWIPWSLASSSPSLTPGLGITGPIAAVGGNVALSSPLTAVATTTTNLDVFYFDNAGRLQHVYWANEPWQFDNSLIGNVAASGLLPGQLSAVARKPSNIDLAFPCSSSGICVVPVSCDKTVFPDGHCVQDTADLLAANFPAPAVATPPQGLVSIVATHSYFLDVIADSGTTSTDLSWQEGARAWVQTGPVPTCLATGCKSYSIAATPSSSLVAPGGSFAVTLSSTLFAPGDHTAPIYFSYRLPVGVVSDFLPATLAAGQSANLTFTVPAPNTLAHDGRITIHSDNGVETDDVSVLFTVTGPPPVVAPRTGLTNPSGAELPRDGSVILADVSGWTGTQGVLQGYVTYPDGNTSHDSFIWFDASAGLYHAYFNPPGVTAGQPYPDALLYGPDHISYPASDLPAVVSRSSQPQSKLGLRVVNAETGGASSTTVVIAGPTLSVTGYDGTGSTVAIFTDTNQRLSSTDYTAQIDYGDGAVVTCDAPGVDCSVVAWSGNGDPSFASVGHSIYYLQSTHSYAASPANPRVVTVTAKDHRAVRVQNNR